MIAYSELNKRQRKAWSALLLQKTYENAGYSPEEAVYLLQAFRLAKAVVQTIAQEKRLANSTTHEQWELGRVERARAELKK